ncbi:MAG: hypothetical protein Kow0068_17370 [Marinilabiliales bacterium]
MLMKNSVLKITSLMIFAIIIMATSAYSQVDKPIAQREKPQKAPVERSKMVIDRTAKVIHEAHKALQQGKNYTGDLAAAVKHQKYAIQLHKEGKYKLAAEHSLYARKRAVKVLKANNVDVNPMYEKQPKNAENLTPDSELEQAVSNLPDENEQELVKENTLEITVK